MIRTGQCEEHAHLGGVVYVPRFLSPVSSVSSCAVASVSFFSLFTLLYLPDGFLLCVSFDRGVDSMFRTPPFLRLGPPPPQLLHFFLMLLIAQTYTFVIY